jgi:hypothetical protein
MGVFNIAHEFTSVDEFLAGAKSLPVNRPLSLSRRGSASASPIS